jgi:hypothetical protein
MVREGNDELAHFYRAIELDPNYAAAHGLAARTYVQRNAGGWVTDRPHDLAEASRLARRAVEPQMGAFACNRSIAFRIRCHVWAPAMSPSSSSWSARSAAPREATCTLRPRELLAFDGGHAVANLIWLWERPVKALLSRLGQ